MREGRQKRKELESSRERQRGASTWNNYRGNSGKQNERTHDQNVAMILF